MTKKPRCIPSNASIQDAIDEMFASGVRHLPIVDEGILVGLICDRDVRSYLLPADKKLMDPDEARARVAVSVFEIAIKDPLTVADQTPVREVIDLMLSRNFGAVPVVSDSSQILGIISYVDILKSLRETM
jgi:acetoin utilization protein AcuB